MILGIALLGLASAALATPASAAECGAHAKVPFAPDQKEKVSGDQCNCRVSYSWPDPIRCEAHDYEPQP